MFEENLEETTKEKDIDNWVNSRIKGQIGEVIFEELFINLGFFVIKIGQEHTARPITQIEKFMKECGGEFKLDKKTEDHIELDYIRRLPDFLIIDKKGRVNLIEVKYRKSGKLNPKKLESLEIYKNSEIFLLSLNEKERFHIYSLDDKDVKIIGLREWLKQKFNIENEEVISKFEEIAKNWYEQPKQKNEKSKQ